MNFKDNLKSNLKKYFDDLFSDVNILSLENLDSLEKSALRMVGRFFINAFESTKSKHEFILGTSPYEYNLNYLLSYKRNIQTLVIFLTVDTTTEIKITITHIEDYTSVKFENVNDNNKISLREKIQHLALVESYYNYLNDILREVDVNNAVN